MRAHTARSSIFRAAFVACIAGGCATNEVAPSASLAGTRWQLIEASFALAPPPAPRPTLELRVDRLSAAGGCNLAMGGYREIRGRLEVGSLAATRRACTYEIDRAEHAYFALLSDGPAFEIQGNVLVLSTPNARARFVRLPASGGEPISRAAPPQASVAWRSAIGRVPARCSLTPGRPTAGLLLTTCS